MKTSMPKKKAEIRANRLQRRLKLLHEAMRRDLLLLKRIVSKINTK